MYILKTGTSNTVTEYLQLRDSEFALVEYIKLSLLPKIINQWIEKYNLKTTAQQLTGKILSAPYNKLVKI